MIYRIFIRYLELPKWLYTRINYSVDSIAVTVLYCTTLYVLLYDYTWLFPDPWECTRKWI